MQVSPLEHDMKEQQTEDGIYFSQLPDSPPRGPHPTPIQGTPTPNLPVAALEPRADVFEDEWSAVLTGDGGATPTILDGSLMPR